MPCLRFLMFFSMKNVPRAMGIPFGSAEEHTYTKSGQVASPPRRTLAYA